MDRTILETIAFYRDTVREIRDISRHAYDQAETHPDNASAYHSFALGQVWAIAKRALDEHDGNDDRERVPPGEESLGAAQQ